MSSLVTIERAVILVEQPMGLIAPFFFHFLDLSLSLMVNSEHLSSIYPLIFKCCSSCKTMHREGGLDILGRRSDLLLVQLLCKAPTEYPSLLFTLIPPFFSSSNNHFICAKRGNSNGHFWACQALKSCFKKRQLCIFRARTAFAGWRNFPGWKARNLSSEIPKRPLLPLFSLERHRRKVWHFQVGFVKLASLDMRSSRNLPIDRPESATFLGLQDILMT